MCKPTVLFDADGFLLDFLTPALSVANRVTGHEWKPEDFPTWDIFDTLGREVERECYLEYEKPGFCESFLPYPGAVDGVRRAKEMANVIIVTSPLHSPPWMYERTMALFNHFNIPRSDVIFAKKKYLIYGDILVDDNPGNVLDWARANRGHVGVGVLWEQPYNKQATIQDIGCPAFTLRCSSWDGPDGLLEIIESKAKGHNGRYLRKENVIVG